MAHWARRNTWKQYEFGGLKNYKYWLPSSLVYFLKWQPCHFPVMEFCLSPCEQSKFNWKKKSTYPPYMVSVCLLQKFYPNYLRTGKTQWSEIFLGHFLSVKWPVGPGSRAETETFCPNISAVCHGIELKFSK